MSQARLPNPFPLLEILSVLALGCGLVGLGIPICWRCHSEADNVSCTGRLKCIYGVALGYALKKGNNAYPIGDRTAPAAHESLNKLVDYEEGLNPKMFICPGGEASAAEPNRLGTFWLTPETLSYSWVKERMRSTTPNRALSSDKYVDGFVDKAGRHPGHLNGMQVLMTDGCVSFVPEDELPPATKLPEGLTR